MNKQLTSAIFGTSLALTTGIFPAHTQQRLSPNDLAQYIQREIIEKRGGVCIRVDGISNPFPFVTRLDGNTHRKITPQTITAGLILISNEGRNITARTITEKFNPSTKQAEKTNLAAVKEGASICTIIPQHLDKIGDPYCYAFPGNNRHQPGNYRAAFDFSQNFGTMMDVLCSNSLNRN